MRTERSNSGQKNVRATKGLCSIAHSFRLRIIRKNTKPCSFTSFNRHHSFVGRPSSLTVATLTPVGSLTLAVIASLSHFFKLFYRIRIAIMLRKCLFAIIPHEYHVGPFSFFFVENKKPFATARLSIVR